MDDLVSIVIPVYNKEKYLDELISSCLNQTYSKIEIIAVNDGSTDNSLEILKNYGDKILIKTQENRGVSSATNSGIRSMNGKLFKIMDADDILYPEGVELLVSEFFKVDDKKTVIHAWGDIIDNKGEVIREYRYPNYNNLSKFDQNVILLDHNIVLHGATLLHRDTFFQCGFHDESLRAGIDYELWLRLCLQFNFKLHLLEKKIVKMRRIKGKGITANANKETPNYSEEIRNLVLSRLDFLTRKKYENALKFYMERNQPTLAGKTKNNINDLILKIFSPSSARKIANAYRTIMKKK